MADWKDILSENDEQLSEDELLKYFDGNLPKEEQTFIKEKISKSNFDAEALEGLSQLQNKENIEKHVKQLKRRLTQLTNKKIRKQKAPVKVFDWIILAILVLLFICIVGYVVINLQNKNHYHSGLAALNDLFYLSILW